MEIHATNYAIVRLKFLCRTFDENLFEFKEISFKKPVNEFVVLKCNY